METTKKKPVEGDNVKLSGEQVLSEMSVDSSSRREYQGSRAGQFFYIGNHMGFGFTCSEEFFGDWKAGKVAEVNFVFKPYLRSTEDPKRPGSKIEEMRDAWSLVGYATWEQTKGAKKNIGEMKLIDKELELDYRISFARKLKGLELDDNAMAMLKEAI